MGITWYIMSSLSQRFLRLANARKAQDLDGAAANVQGWVRSIRKQGKISFVELNDGSCVKHMQVVVPTGSLPEKLTVGSSVGVAGVLDLTGIKSLWLRVLLYHTK